MLNQIQFFIEFNFYFYSVYYEVFLRSLTTVIRDNFGRISMIIPDQLNNNNLLVVCLAIIMLVKWKTNFPAINFECSWKPIVYLNLKVSNVTLKQWGYFGQSYILRFKTETIEISYYNCCLYSSWLQTGTI